MNERLLQILTEPVFGGAERVVLDLVRGLGDRWDVTVASLVPCGSDTRYADALRDAGARVMDFGIGGRLDVRARGKVARGIAGCDPAVIHAHLDHPIILTRLARPTDGPVLVCSHHVVERRRVPIRRWLLRRTAGRDDATICVSEAVALYARGSLGARAPLIIHDGIDVDRVASLPGRETARAALGLPETGPVIGAIGRLDRQKGFDELIQALGALAEDVSLVIAGEGPERAALLERARRIGRASHVHLPGYLPDIRDVLAASDVFCAPSRWEGFGLAVGEAMAAGVPVVVRSVDSLPEVVGEAGVLVEPGDELAAPLRALLGDDARRRDLADAGRRRAARFTVETMVARHDALYCELLAGRAAAPSAPGP